MILLPPEMASAHPLEQESLPTPAEVIAAVNALRVENGLPALNTHPVLMQVAQWEANAIAGGAPGHTRPDGLTLGQWLISLGYPLSGDLSLDGYRSENWVAAQTAQQAIQLWLGDAPHTNTMLSPNRSDIGAGVASSDQIYIVIETALQTNSGQMQSEANDIQTAVAGESPQDASEAPVLQYIMPIRQSTAHPNGDVYHQVLYGQSLWSIATHYHTTIAQLRAWNNLDDSGTVYEGQTLLVQRGATQPPPASATPLAASTASRANAPATYAASSASPTATIQVTPANASEPPKPGAKPSGVWVGVIILLALLGGGLGTWLTSRPNMDSPEKP
jgi:LysM repeat protein